MINDIIDEQKSVMLAKAMGWEPTPVPVPDVPLLVMFKTNSGESLYSTSVLCQMSLDDFWERHMPNLYHPQHMALAWRVLNWAMAEEIEGRLVVNGSKVPLTDWYVEQDLDCKPPDVAQRAWLDKIFELAIEAGLVDAEGVKVG